jgi:hypothetical protein
MIDVKDAYVSVPIEEESNYIFLNNYIKSNKDKESPNLKEFDIHDILSKEEVIAQNVSDPIGTIKVTDHNDLWNKCGHGSGLWCYSSKHCWQVKAET